MECDGNNGMGIILACDGNGPLIGCAGPPAPGLCWPGPPALCGGPGPAPGLWWAWASCSPCAGPPAPGCGGPGPPAPACGGLGLLLLPLLAWASCSRPVLGLLLPLCWPMLPACGGLASCSRPVLGLLLPPGPPAPGCLGSCSRPVVGLGLLLPACAGLPAPGLWWAGPPAPGL